MFESKLSDLIYFPCLYGKKCAESTANTNVRADQNARLSPTDVLSVLPAGVFTIQTTINLYLDTILTLQIKSTGLCPNIHEGLLISKDSLIVINV